MIKLDNLQSRYSFYCDENFPEPSMRHLKKRGFKAIHSNDVRNNNNTDMQQFKYAKRLKSILITNDFDFISFKEKGCDMNNTGIIIFNTNNPVNTNKLIDKLIRDLEKTNRILYKNVTTVSTTGVSQR